MGAEENVQGGQQLIDLAVHLLPGDAPETIPRMTAHEDIFSHVKVGKKHRLLVKYRDAQRLCLGRRTQLDNLATDLYCACIWPVNTCQDLDQGAFAGPVLAG